MRSERHCVALMVLSVVSVGLLTFWSADARAANILEEDDFELSLGGEAAVVYGAEFPEGEEANYGPNVSLARLKMSGGPVDIGEFRLQLAGATGNIELLDAAVYLTALDPIELRAGLFKTPVLSEFLVGAAELPMIDRALLNRFVPRRRTGLDVVGKFEAGEVKLQGHLGLFMPARATFSDPEGQLLTARFLAEFPAGVDLHVGYANLLFDGNNLDGVDPAAPEADRRVVPYESPLTFAVIYEGEHFWGRAETVQILDPPGGDYATANYLNTGYRFGSKDQLQFEPTVAYDYVYDTESLHRVAAGLNLHFWDTGFYSTLNYRFRTGGLNEHSLFLRLTGAI